MRYWQEIRSGETFTSAQLKINEADILEFAAEFDPQPYHLDRSAAEESIFGGLCASGWQVSAMMMRLITDTLQEQRVAILGSSGVKSLRWKLPVFAGDILTAKLTIVDCQSSAEADLGSLECSVEVCNQNGKPVLVSSITMLVLMTGKPDETAGSSNE